MSWENEKWRLGALLCNLILLMPYGLFSVWGGMSTDHEARAWIALGALSLVLGVLNVIAIWTGPLGAKRVAMTFANASLFVVFIVFALLHSRVDLGFVNPVSRAPFIELGPLAITPATTVVALWNVTKARVAKNGRCPRCEYCLEGLPAMQCPECGWEGDQS